MLIEALKSCLLMVDMQERLLPAIDEFERVIQKCALLLNVAEKLDLPLIITEQYPKGLGPTVPELESKNATMFEKLSFSGFRDDKIRAHFKMLEDSGIKHVIVCGIEAHVCVMQTALELKQAGFGVFVVLMLVRRARLRPLTWPCRECDKQVCKWLIAKWWSLS